MLTQPYQATGNDQVLYRYENSQFQGDFYEIKLDLKEFRIVRKTPKGFWIWIGWGRYENYLDSEYINGSDAKQYAAEQLKAGLKWVSNDGRKRFAYPTKAEAMVNFKKRKERQIKILKSQLSRAEDALRAINMVINPNIVNVIKNETL